MRKCAFASAAVIAAASLSAMPVFGTNIIQNGGFETPDPGGGSSVAQFWNQTNPTITRDTTNPHAGSAEEYINNTAAPSADFLFQDTPVGSVSPGDALTLSFYYSGITPNGGELQSRVVFFSNGSGPTAFEPFNYNYPTSNTPYQLATYTIPAAPAGTSFAELQFFAATGAATGSIAQIYLDDVSLSTSGSGGGGGGLGPSTWNMSSGGDYNTGSNWTAGNPSGVGAEADLLSAITAPANITSASAITLGTLNFNNANTYTLSTSGGGSLTMQATSGSATVIVQQGTQQISLPTTFASNTNLNVSSGATLQIAGALTVNPGVTVAPTNTGSVSYQSTVSVEAGGSLTFGNSTYPLSLTLLGNATAAVTASTGTRKLLQLNNISLSVSSSLDLNNNDLVVHGGTLSIVDPLIQSGYNGGAWNGLGIKSSSAASDTRHLTAIGVIANNNGQGSPLYGIGTAAGLFDGISPALGDILVKYTYYGDANLDGKVDGSDYSRIDSSYLAERGGGPISGWYNGDYNYDNVVDGSDYTLIDNAYNSQGNQIAAAAAQVAVTTAEIARSGSVPEPTALSLVGIGTLGLLRRRRSN